jgi:hypothetical protein
MWEVKRIFDPQFLLNPGVILNEDPEVHSKNIRLDFPVPSLYLPCTFPVPFTGALQEYPARLPCTFPVPSLYLPQVHSKNIRLDFPSHDLVGRDRDSHTTTARAT